MSNQLRARSGGKSCCGDLLQLLEPRFFKALGDPRRVAILARLLELGGPATVSEIAACCPTDLSVVSRHLAILRDAGILEAQKSGKEVYYEVRGVELVKTLRVLADAVEARSVARPITIRKRGTT